MVKLTIVISEQEYLIKFNKDEFDLSLIKNLLKRINFEQNQFSEESITEIEDLKFSQLNYESLSRFDCLRDK
jgi:hypothetical protein